MVFLDMLFSCAIYAIIIYVAVKKNKEKKNANDIYKSSKEKIYPNLYGDKEKIYPEDNCKIDLSGLDIKNDIGEIIDKYDKKNYYDGIFSGDSNVDPIIEYPNVFNLHHKVTRL